MSIADKGGIQMSSFNKTVDGQDIEGFIIRAPRVTTNCIHQHVRCFSCDEIRRGVAINMEWCKSCGCIRELVLDIGWTNWERPHTLDAEPDGVVAKKEA